MTEETKAEQLLMLGQIDEVKAYVAVSLKEDIGFLCDDPHGTFMTGSEYEMSAKEIVEYVEKLDRLCDFCGLEFSAEVVRCATDYEFKRLMELITNARGKVGWKDGDLQRA